MPKFFLIFLITLLSFLQRCSKSNGAPNKQHRDFENAISTPLTPPENESLISIETNFGTIKCRLYNETPKHRDNFVKLVEGGYYDSLLFHRVIKNFVIQGGDPDSKNAKKEVLLGDGGPGYNIPAEFSTEKHFHKKGALAAARESDDINPNKESSGSQFYIVQGKIQDEGLLQKNERRINRSIMQKIVDSLLMLPKNSYLKNKILSIKNQEGNKDSLGYFQRRIDSLAEPVYQKHKKYLIPESHRAVYKKIGGTPHLDSHYTVFGEVYEGLDVLDKILESETDINDRPKKDVRMKIRVIRKIN